jgi:outer membrane protein TolC
MNSGLESFLSVLDARRSLYASEDRLASGETAVVASLIALYNLYKAFGGGWDPDGPTSLITSQVGSRAASGGE